MTEEMFKALMELIDAKIAIITSRDSSDGGLIEINRYNEMEKEFKERFIDENEIDADLQDELNKVRLGF